MSRRRYAIIGSGALGGLYGGMLARAGHEVHFLLNSDYQYVQQHGLKVESVWGDFHLPDVNAHSNAESFPACDVTILALKSTNNHLLGRLLPPTTREGGVVLCLQNGLDVERDAASVVGEDRLLGGCCFLCSNKVGPGHIRHLDQGRIVFGPWSPVLGDSDCTPHAGGNKIAGGISQGLNSISEEICNDLVSSGIDAKVTEDLAETRWRKLMWNIPFNGLSVVLNASTQEIMNSPAAVDLARQLIVEVHQGAAECGVNVPEMMIEKMIEVTRDMVPYDSSMRLDYLAKRPMEIQAIFGNPIRRATEAGFEMPSVQVIKRQLEFLQSRYL